MAEKRAVSILIAGVSDVDIRDALTSALSQTVTPAEVIVAINPSDYRDEIKQHIASKAPLVRACVPRQDSGIGALLRTASEMVTGTHVAWMRGGDILDARKIEMQLAALDKLQGNGGMAISTGLLRVSSAPPVTVLHADSSVPEADEDPVSILASVLTERRDPGTLLVDRSFLEQVGGFDPSFALTPELDITARLAARFAFAHVPAALVRRGDNLPSSDRLAREKAEVQRVWTRVFEQDTPSLIAAGRLTSALGRNGSFVGPALRNRVASLVSDRTLTVVVLRHGSADTAIPAVKSRLGLPGARYISVEGRDEDALSALVEAARKSDSEWIMAFGSSALPAPGTVSMQLLQAEGAGLNACLPVPDTIVYQPGPPSSLILGTVFRRSALAAGIWASDATEAAFWNVFASSGRVGALPPVNNVEQPGPMRRSATLKLTVADLAFAAVDRQWYLRKQPDVAKAKADPVQHYVAHGWRENRDPNPWFNSAWYLQHHPSLQSDDVSPLEHFLEHGDMFDIWSRPGFDLRWTVRQYLGSRQATFEALLEFFLPGLRAVADRAGLDAATARHDVEAVVPNLVAIIRALENGELATQERVIGLIDVQWYLEVHTDVARAKVDPLEHYLTYGWRERRDPNAWFATNWYVEQKPEAAHPQRSVVEHFVQKGAMEGQNPHPGFHLQWYARRYLPGTPLGSDVLLHFLKTGAANGAVPDPRLDRAEIRKQLHAVPANGRAARIRELQALLGDEHRTILSLIDQDWYRDKNPDVAQANVDVTTHYLTYGWRERRDPNPWFSTWWYLAQNPKVAQSGMCPLVHYIQYGAAEGLRPCPAFDPEWYTSHYLGVDSPSTDALAHFLSSGIQHGAAPNPALNRTDILKQVAACRPYDRSALLHHLNAVVTAEEEIATALVDATWYGATYSQDPTALVNALEHFREIGWREGRNPSPWFHTQWYLERNPEARTEDLCPLDHFIRIGASEGRNPHPAFDVEWYSRHYLSGSKPTAEALLHFMTIGLDSGASPDPRLATPAVRKRLIDTPAADRAAYIAKLLAVLSRTPADCQPWDESDAALWPSLLTRSFPENAVAVLLLSQNSPAARDQARAASMALSLEEAALFGFIDDDCELCLSDSVDEDAVSVVLTLPKEIGALRTLLAALPCRRAAAIGSNLLDTPVIRAVRNAGVPVFTNGPAA